MNSRHDQESPQQARREGATGLSGGNWIVPALYGFLVIGIVVSGVASDGRGASDQRMFHLPTIRDFAQQLPFPDLSSYGAPSTPLYHLGFAVIARITESLTLLRFINCLIGILAIYAASTLFPRAASTRAGVLTILPLGVSFYMVSAAPWLSPEILGWLLVFLLLALCIKRSPFSPGTAMVAGLLWSVLLLTRQLHAWVSVPLVLSSLTFHISNHKTLSLIHILEDLRTRWRVLLSLFLGALPGLLGYGILIFHWRGLQPPLFLEEQRLISANAVAETNQGLSPIAPAFILVVVAAYGSIILPAVLSPKQARNAWRWAVLGMGAGALVSFPPSSYDIAQGRWSGFYELAKYFPHVGSHSLIVMVGAALGGAVLGLLLSRLTSHERWVVGSILLSFAVASLANAFVLQRYYEPLVLLMLTLMAHWINGRETSKHLWKALSALTLVLAGITAGELLG